jgi:hypothetical protein
MNFNQQNKQTQSAVMTRVNRTALVFLLACGISSQGLANTKPNTLSLQNLERERAALINDMLDMNLDMSQRLSKITKRQRQLTDMERMVMRDERLLNTQSTLVTNAFAQYEQTFLVHAGAEQNRSASQQWLANVNISNDAVLNSRMAYRK